MRELKVTTCTVQSENREPLALCYSILVEETAEGLERYGVQIIEKNSGASAVVPGITMSSQRIESLIQMLADNTVSPTGLMDVLADWL